jgi:16S rRNA pseudouridine516 synthase
MRNFMQLERLLRSQGFGSRPECRSLINNGKILINGVVCDDPLEDFEPHGLHFTVEGKEWLFREFVYLLLNKPADYECSHKPKFHRSVYTLLPKPLITRGVQAVGRLDEDTTGLLLFSDDGQFIHKFTSPKKKVSKIYDITTKHDLNETQIQLLLTGVRLNDEPDEVRAIACESIDSRILRMTVTEGKYHLVKRMIAAAGNRVELLNRVSIGGLVLPDDIKPGEWRWIELTEFDT